MMIQDKPADLEDILLREMHHRFCNSLQLISVMAATMLRASPGTDIRDGLERIQDRIGVLAQLHRLLAEPLREGELGPACEALCANLLLTFTGLASPRLAGAR
jgi:two-component sensor histidine kinase